MNHLEVLRSNKKSVTVVLLIVAIFASLNGNSLFVISGFCLLIILFLNLYVVNVPNVLLLIGVYYWIQIFATVFQKNVLRQDMDDYPMLLKAVTLSSIGLIAVVLVFRSQLRSIRVPTNKEIAFFASQFNDVKLFIAFVTYLFLGNTIIDFLRNLIPALNQFWFVLNSITWLLFSLLFFKCFYANGKKIYLVVAVLLSFVSGFYSYFSDFKDVFFYLFILGISLPYLFRLKQFVVASLVFFLVFQFAILWTGIKAEYRTYLSGGERLQQVTVERNDAMAKLYLLVTNLDRKRYESAHQALWDRIQYQKLFSVVLERVPEVLPHENGNLWLSNLTFVFTPRFLNPNKGILDPSTKSTKYTGISFANVAMGTSISLGYFVECYIDFGEVGMIFPILIIAFIIGRSFRYFASDVKQNVVVRYALAIAALGSFYIMESDGISLIGRLFFSITTFYALEKFFLKSLLLLVKI